MPAAPAGPPREGAHPPLADTGTLVGLGLADPPPVPAPADAAATHRPNAPGSTTP